MTLYTTRTVTISQLCAKQYFCSDIVAEIMNYAYYDITKLARQRLNIIIHQITHPATYSTVARSNYLPTEWVFWINHENNPQMQADFCIKCGNYENTGLLHKYQGARIMCKCI